MVKKLPMKKITKIIKKYLKSPQKLSKKAYSSLLDEERFEHITSYTRPETGKRKERK